MCQCRDLSEAAHALQHQLDPLKYVVIQTDSKVVCGLEHGRAEAAESEISLMDNGSKDVLNFFRLCSFLLDDAEGAEIWMKKSGPEPQPELFFTG